MDQTKMAHELRAIADQLVDDVAYTIPSPLPGRAIPVPTFDAPDRVLLDPAPAEARPMPQVQAFICALSEEVGITDELVDALVARLNPVTSPIEDSSFPVDAPWVVPIADIVRAQQMRLMRINSLLRNLLSALEL